MESGIHSTSRRDASLDNEAWHEVQRVIDGAAAPAAPPQTLATPTYAPSDAPRPADEGNVLADAQLAPLLAEARDRRASYREFREPLVSGLIAAAILFAAVFIASLLIGGAR